jgi:hypothetical protein
MSGKNIIPQSNSARNGQSLSIPPQGIEIKHGHITLTLSPAQASLLVRACDQVQFSDPTEQILIDSLASMLKAGLTAAVCQCWLGSEAGIEATAELAAHLGNKQ